MVLITYINTEKDVYNIPLEISHLNPFSKSSEVPQNRYDLPSTRSQAPPP